MLVFWPKGPQNRAFCKVFRKFCDFVFLKTVWKESYHDTWLLIPNSMHGKILGLELLPKMLVTNQIVEDFWNSNISRISWGMKMIFLWVSHKSTEFGLAWLGIARSVQKHTWEIYSKDRCGQVSFEYWIPINRGSYGNHMEICSFLTASFSQFDIFHRSRWLVFFWFFNEVTLFLHLRNDSLLLAEIPLLLVFGQKGPKIWHFCKFFRKFCGFIFL